MISFKEFFAEATSRPGRAKRAGVDCSKSKTELRKIAKNSSGEKQKMAHFCANMKSGKKKSDEETPSEDEQRLDDKCWKGYKKQGTKIKGGKRVNNCVKK